jgi:hypothetical protein
VRNKSSYSSADMACLAVCISQLSVTATGMFLFGPRCFVIWELYMVLGRSDLKLTV